MATFLFTVVGTTRFLVVLVGQFPGDWGFFVPYLTRSILLVVLAINNISPGFCYSYIRFNYGCMTAALKFYYGW
ncbi:hypothetical protein VPH35_020152 [Triticum aestivum]